MKGKSQIRFRLKDKKLLHKTVINSAIGAFQRMRPTNDTCVVVLYCHDMPQGDSAGEAAPQQVADAAHSSRQFLEMAGEDGN